MIDGHPYANVFNDGDDATDLTVRYPYFHPEPMRFEPGPTYTVDEILKTSSYEWMHPISEIFNSIISAGLSIEFLHEFPVNCYQHLPMMVQGDDGWWRLPEHAESVPQLYSLKTTLPAQG